MPHGPEDDARDNIDDMLQAAGWAVQHRDSYDPGVPERGIAVREYPFETGPADYLLVVDREAVGVIEAKPEGVALGGVAEQSEDYATSDPKTIPAAEEPLPFVYESTGVETNFRDLRDPQPRAREVFHFHQPETLADWIGQSRTLRGRLQRMPLLQQGILRDCQYEAIENLERSFAGNHPRSLIQMATGSGKTFMAVTECYRLLKHGKAHRILFLVDRKNLGKQTEKEFQQYTIPESGRPFTQEYNVQHLQSDVIDDVSDVCITTIQRVYSMLKGGDPEDLDEDTSAFETTPTGEIRDVMYSSEVPPETFDFIIVDECHRSIYNVWRQVLEYFDAFVVGLTATPSKQTLGFFQKQLVSEYPYERSVAHDVNVPYEVFKIRTEITEEGSSVDAGYTVEQREKKTRRTRMQELDEELEYEASDLDRDVVTPSQIRTVLSTFRDEARNRLFPERSMFPKTLVFTKDDNHADDVLRILREEFEVGNRFAKKVTYTVQDPEDVIQQFRNSVYPRVVVSVDMISTGTDVKPLEILLFMRNVKSSVYFEQMLGRGTRTIDSSDLQAVSGEEAQAKTHFVLVDAVGVTENKKTDASPLDREPSASFDQLVRGAVEGSARDEDTMASLGDRFARMNRALEPEDRTEIEEALEESAEERDHGVETMTELTEGFVRAADYDEQVKRAQETFGTEDPTEEQIEQATEELIDEACQPIEDASVRETIQQVRERSYVTIDDISQDEVIEVEHETPASANWAHDRVGSFEDFIEEHKDEITALEIFYDQPHGERHLTLEQIQELAEAIKQPPLETTPEELWKAYAQLDEDKVKGVAEDRLLTDVISLVRHAMGEDEKLEPFREEVEERFYQWLEHQDRQQRFTTEQLEWLEMIKEHLAANLTIEEDDFEYSPFGDKGGIYKAHALFDDDELDAILNELNDVVAA
ncbi:type I restriction-modification enzyme R subunit C-terminal domain-containing protein [Salinibacter sp.]|uniref:type I restriction endonuclease subunit R n=1 Tax=Salinibacter sp. TaxID=2065818 RepID=UPI0021E96E28|nr:type I restriction-modification enzyme R subunit C-terminal domain-containing protein [Salinibacter sp.]